MDINDPGAGSNKHSASEEKRSLRKNMNLRQKEDALFGFRYDYGFRNRPTSADEKEKTSASPVVRKRNRRTKKQAAAPTSPSRFSRGDSTFSLRIPQDDKSGSVRSDTSDDVKEINRHISISDLKRLRYKRPVGRRLQTVFGIVTPMSRAEFTAATSKLYKCCLKGVDDLHDLHLRRLNGQRILNDIIERDGYRYITISDVVYIVWSVMSCIHHALLRVKTFTSGFILWCRKRQLRKAMMIYNKLVQVIDVDMHRITLHAIITFYKEGRLWEVEFPCASLLVSLLGVYKHAEVGIGDLLHAVEYSTLINTQEAKLLIRVVYYTLKRISWRHMSERLMTKLVRMYESSITPSDTDVFNYEPLKRGLELCIVHIIHNLRKRKNLVRFMDVILKATAPPPVKKEVASNFVRIAVDAATRYRTNTNRPLSRKGPLPLLFHLFAVNHPALNNFCLKIWTSLLDVNRNSANFLTPRIYFKGCDRSMTVGVCHKDDMAFFKSIRHFVFQITVLGLVHAKTRGVLDDYHQMIALTITTLPCGYTASCYVSVAMAVQDLAFRVSVAELIRSHHLHAFVMSVMTLICLIFDAATLFDYVHSVCERRATFAPQLNPPLRSRYEYAQHHILWNRADLFFEDWETRYGLWLCFRSKKGSDTFLKH